MFGVVAAEAGVAEPCRRNGPKHSVPGEADAASRFQRSDRKCLQLSQMIVRSEDVQA